MASVTITKHQSAYLERTARRLSDLAGRRITKAAVLSTLLDVAIEDEGVYDPQSSEPLDPYRKRICQAEREARTVSFDIESLLIACRS